MKTLQEKMYNIFSEIADRIEEGFYGEGNEFDITALSEDLKEVDFIIESKIDEKD